MELGRVDADCVRDSWSRLDFARVSRLADGRARHRILLHGGSAGVVAGAGVVAVGAAAAGSRLVKVARVGRAGRMHCALGSAGDSDRGSGRLPVYVGFADGLVDCERGGVLSGIACGNAGEISTGSWWRCMGELRDTDSEGSVVGI